MNKIEEFNKKLLVEGNDDQHVVWALCKEFNVPKVFDVVDCDGIDKLFNRFKVECSIKKSEVFGIVIDADTNLQSRWTSVSKILINNNFNIPTTLPKEGLIFDNGEQKIGVWIMPNNNLNGILEDFISFLVPQEDNLMPIATETLQNIENKGLDKYRPHKSKAKIHTWLAWQEEPGKPFGQSITNKVLSTDNDTCQKFVTWLTELFK
ncbi:hypothetical protein FACS189440_10500 [Bacteroidia bacterium]|nr:hypothetical protein FACS189440_10500 [Bacteroidia bacterium]